MNPVRFIGELYSPEHKRRFKTESSVAEIKPSTSDPDRLKFTIDGVSDTNWFRQKQQEFLKKLGINPPEQKNNSGLKL